MYFSHTLSRSFQWLPLKIDDCFSVPSRLLLYYRDGYGYGTGLL